MRTPVKRIEAASGVGRAIASAGRGRGGASAVLALLLLAAFVMAVATPALAQVAEPAPAPREIDDLWIPSFGITSGITVQRQEGAVSSRNVTFGVPLRPSADGRYWAVTPYLGINLQLETPVVRAIPGRPRFFIDAEFLPSFGDKLNLAQEGAPTGIDVPTGPGIDESAISGVGSRTRAQVQPLACGANAGLSLPFEWNGRQVHVKPSIGFFRYAVEVKGKVLAGLKPSPDYPYTRLIDLEDQRTQPFIGVGPGVELELDTGRFGPIAPSIYAEVYGYRIIGDRTVSFRKNTGVISCPAGSPPVCSFILPPADYQAHWNYKEDPWIYRGGLGIRFRWVGN